jgi:3-deoxy-D-manno-octulosonic-acid transferase
MRSIYTLLLYLLVPWALLRLVWRSRREPGYLDHVAERFGAYQEIPGTPLIWVHAVSVGETRAAQPLIEALLAKYPQHYVLLTHMTPTGRETGKALFGRNVYRCYLPYDLPGAVADFLDYFQPCAGILMETEIWPNLIAACGKRGIPIYLVNARLSKKSSIRYRRFVKLARESLGGIAGIAAQSAEDGQRLTALGAELVTVTGNLKFDAVPAAGQLELGRAWRSLYGADRPVLLAASTRDGEEELLLAQLDEIAVPALLTVIVPRHPQRFAKVADLMARRGLKFQARSENAAIRPETRVVLGDSMGEMYAYYSACDVAFVGGSLLPYGGHNLIEACAAGKPALIGPSTHNFAEAVQEAVRAGAAIQVRNAPALAREAARLLLDPAAAGRMGAAGMTFCAAHRGALARVLELIKIRDPNISVALLTANERTRRSP